MEEIKDRIKATMNQADMTSASLAQKTGLAASSISQYLSGKTKPSERALLKIAAALNTSFEYLLGKEVKIVQSVQVANKNLTCEEVAQLMGKGKNFVRKGLQDGVFPWGYAVKTSSKWTYFISAKKFTEATGIEVD